VEIFILLDRTGSMTTRWEEAVSSVNTYIQDIQKAAGIDLLTENDKVTLAAFDRYTDGMDFKVLRDGQAIKSWVPLKIDEVSPRGDTPLLDAVARICGLAESKNAEKTVLVIMTDGAENASREVTKDGARAAIERMKAKNWQIVYLGADFNAFAQAQVLGVAAAGTMSMSSGHFRHATASTATATMDYMTTGKQMKYSAEDRKAAGEDDITKKK
jgi:hypothetical protein